MSEPIATPPTLEQVLEQERKLEIEKSLAINNAFNSGDVNQIYQAQRYVKEIEKREVANTRSLFLDPLEMSASFGYRDKPFQLSYDVLRAMARTHIVKAIIETRKEQVLQFCEPQSNKYATGFIITKRQKYTELGQEVKLSRTDQKKVEYLIEFLLSCGVSSNFWHADTFETFIGKLVKDALELDQATFEIERNVKGSPISFFATDGGTYRIASTYMDDERTTKYPEKIVQGYAPSYVQLYMSKVVAEFYPWELCFGVMNPSTDIRYPGYGRSPLEDMIGTVTSILNSDAYNANFFKVGSAPKGILRYSGNINQNTLDDFKQQWITQVAGVMNAHKVPVINADKLDFINTHIPNKDMEFSKFQEFLIKITCAMYKIDPSEIGFSMSGNSQGTSGLGGDNQEEKVKYSKDKGLKPLLKRIQYWINKYIIWQLDDTFEFRFVGMDQDLDEKTELEQDIELVGNLMTLNEVRQKRGLPKIEGGDIPLNPVFLQAKGMEQQQQQAQQQQDMQSRQQDFTEGQYNDQQEPFGGDNGETEEDPFSKSLANELEFLLCSEP